MRLHGLALALAAAACLATAASASGHVDKPLPRASLDSSLNGALSVSQALAAAPAGVSETWCAGDPGRVSDDVEHAVSNRQRVKVLFAHAADQPNRFAQYADQLQKSVKGMMGVVAHHSGGRKSLRFDMGTACGRGYVDIQTVRLPQSLAAYRGMPGTSRQFTLSLELRDMGFTGPNDYVVFFDDAFTGDSVGAANLSGDSTPGSANTSNRGGAIGFGWGYGQASFFGDATGEYALIHVPLHEIFHGLGAVNFYAPHASSPSGHCEDEYDLLCGQSTRPLSFPCGPDTTNLVLDCNKDDYFAPGGTITGTNGQTIWNTYDSVFLCPLARCANTPPTAAIATGGGDVGGAVAFTAAGSSDDEGIARYEWDLDGDGSYETDTGVTPRASRSFGVPGVRTAGVRVTDTDEIARSATTSFTVEATGASGSPGSGSPVGAARVVSLSLRPSRFRVPKRTTGRAATILYSLDKPATTTLGVERAGPGRRAGGRCVKPSRHNRKGRKCTRYVRLEGQLTDAGESGPNALAWNGRLGRSALAAGSYRLSATPAGGKPRTAKFRVTR